MKQKNRLIIKTSSLVFGVALLFGGVFASGGVWSVKDEANTIGARLTLEGKISVTFYNHDGTEYYNEILSPGSTLSSVPSSPSLSGYTFDGWSTSNSTYEKNNDNLATKVFNTDANYYPRFASYGYQIGSNSSNKLNNSRDASNNVSLTASSSVKLGTYIKGKLDLESYTTFNSVPYDGQYALTCHNGSDYSWSSTVSSALSNWSIERYYLVNSNSLWDNLKLFARVEGNDMSTQNEFMDAVSGVANQYSFYGDYRATTITLGAVNNDVSIIPDNIDGAARHLDPITVSSTGTFSLPSTRVFYLTGDFFPGDDADWGINTSYALIGSGNEYKFTGISLTAGQKLKVISNMHEWYGTGTWSGCGFSTDTDGNLVVDRTGVYDIGFNPNDSEGHHIYLDAVEVTFRFLNTSGKDAYLLSDWGGWDVDPSLKFTLVSGETDLYEYKAKIHQSDGKNYKFVYYSGSAIDWTTLNADNRTIDLGTTNYVYETSKATITFTTTGWTDQSSMVVVGTFNGWSTSSNCVTLTKNSTGWSGSRAFEKGTYIEFKFVGSGSNWYPNGDNMSITVSGDTSISLNSRY